MPWETKSPLSCFTTCFLGGLDVQKGQVAAGDKQRQAGDEQIARSEHLPRSANPKEIPKYEPRFGVNEGGPRRGRVTSPKWGRWAPGELLRVRPDSRCGDGGGGRTATPRGRGSAAQDTQAFGRPGLCAGCPDPCAATGR